MSSIGLYVFIIIVGFFLSVYFYLIYKRNSLLDVEKGKNIIHNEYCGAHFDNSGIFDIFHNNMITTRLTVYDEYIVISYRKKIVLNYDDIDLMVCEGSIPQDPYKPAYHWKRLTIKHKRNDVSRIIKLYVNNCEEVKSIIENQISHSK